MREVAVGDKLDQYEITKLIARSGMASIFEAKDTATGMTVALKVPHLQFESDVVFFERFKREEEIGQRLDHPDRKSTRLNSSHGYISYAVFCLKKKKKRTIHVMHER